MLTTAMAYCSCALQVQDALVGATDKKNSQHEKDGEIFYDYEVTGAVSKQAVPTIIGLLPSALTKADIQLVNHRM